MRKSLTFIGVTAILAVTLLYYLQTSSNTVKTSKLNNDPSNISNLSAKLTGQQAQGKHLTRLEAQYLEQSKQIQVLQQQLAKLSAQFDEMRALPTRKSVARTAQSLAQTTVNRPTIAERFNNNSGMLSDTTTNKLNVEEVVYANLPTNADAPMTDCNGSVCKVYTFGDDPQTTNNDFVKNLSKNLTSNVNVFFVDEQGQQVIYVESVE